MRMIDELIRKADFSALSPGPCFQGGKVDLSSLEPMNLNTALQRCEAQRARVPLSRVPHYCRQGECPACKPGTVQGARWSYMGRSLLLCTKFQKHNFVLHLLEGCLCADFLFSRLRTKLSARYRNPSICMSYFYYLSLLNN